MGHEAMNLRERQLFQRPPHVQFLNFLTMQVRSLLFVKIDLCMFVDNGLKISPDMVYVSQTQKLSTLPPLKYPLMVPRASNVKFYNLLTQGVLV